MSGYQILTHSQKVQIKYSIKLMPERFLKKSTDLSVHDLLPGYFDKKKLT